MGVNEWIQYSIDNPVTRGTVNYVLKVVEQFGVAQQTVPKPPVPVFAPAPLSLFSQCGKGHYLLKVAGLSGSVAVCLGAYGAHRRWSPDSVEGKEYSQEDIDHRKKQFEVANNYHFYHTIALLAVPLARYPILSGALFTSGMIFFCGTIYYSSMSGNRDYNRLAPFGGVCFIVAWLSLIL